MESHTRPGTAGEPFNYAAHLFEINATRADRTAYIDDRGRLSYGDLAERSRRFAAALLAAGVRREERVLLVGARGHHDLGALVPRGAAGGQEAEGDQDDAQRLHGWPAARLRGSSAGPRAHRPG